MCLFVLRHGDVWTAIVDLRRNESLTQFVYFYVQAPDHGEELRLSIASVKTHFVGDATFLVIGEKPAWYDGPHLPLKQFTGIRDNPARMPFRDTQHKNMVAAGSDLVEEEFVWIMDDCFMLKATTLDEMRILHYDPWYRINVKTTWNQLIRITFAALSKHGKSQLQYGIHGPHIFTKTNLRAMFQKYDYPQSLLLFEILYQNEYSEPQNAVPYGANWQGVEYPMFLKRLLRPMTREQLEAIDSNFLNYQARVWNTTMKMFLLSRFG